MTDYTGSVESSATGQYFPGGKFSQKKFGTKVAWLRVTNCLDRQQVNIALSSSSELCLKFQVSS